MAVLAYLVLFLALTGHSSATYCLCKDGMNQQDLQKALDYACGAGADCTPILQSGACYQPNTVKNHCDWAVNSYFQKKGQAQGSCDFSATATTSMTAPTASSTCVFPSSSSQVGTNSTTTPSTTPTTTTPSTSTTPTTTTPSTTTPTTPSTTTPTTPSTTGFTPPTVYGAGISPTGSGATSYNDSEAVPLNRGIALFFFSLALTFCSVLLGGWR
ncbi:PLASMODESMATA CALLOSE-BINDING PROTEIN 3-like [Juglans microcarpa x Juglans regia]|uniref:PLASMODESMATA CALLOSE-BINDING PROTEIN 3-like n=1 Tax=Juglans microcarpa x Juglans regia TaxID=2249226 RepID=UPI001B7D9498|nr:PLASMODESMATA CALLOSE-BINDING PROTEIN 3-like [Juglans microcarpa x Juglans regia]